MPIDITALRKDQGGDPDFWRKNQEERFCDPKVVDEVRNCLFVCFVC